MLSIYWTLLDITFQSLFVDIDSEIVTVPMFGFNIILETSRGAELILYVHCVLWTLFFACDIE